MRIARLGILAVCLMMAIICARAEERAPDFQRAPAEIGYMISTELEKQYEVRTKDGIPIYKPSAPQPLNAYLIVHEDCEVGIAREGMFPVRETGLVEAITQYLALWARQIEEESGGAIRFVADPNAADIMFSACQSFEFYATYSGGGFTSSGYSCRVRIEARKLTSPFAGTSFSVVRYPSESESVTGKAWFWKNPPDLDGAGQLSAFVGQILRWYGWGAELDYEGDGVRALQLRLIERGLLRSGADGIFDSDTALAVRAIQRERGLEPTGTVDTKTMLAIYFDEEYAQ